MRFLETVVSLIILRCDRYLSGIGVNDSLQGFSALEGFVARLDDEAVKDWAKITSDAAPEQAPSAAADIEARYLKLTDLMGHDDVLQSLLDLCLAVFTCPEFDAYLTKHFGYSVTLHLAYLLEGIPFPDETDILDRIRRAQFICDVDMTACPLQYVPLAIDERIYSYLSGDDSINPRLADFTELFEYSDAEGLNPPYVNTDAIQKGIAFFEGDGKVLHLSGSGGRRYIARQIASSINRDFLFLNIADLFTGTNKTALSELKGALIREAVLDDAGICMYGITKLFIGGSAQPDNGRTRRDLEMLERLLFSPVSQAGIPIILISDMPVVLMRSLPESGYRIIELPASLTYAERLGMWKGFIELHGLDISPEDMAVRYHMNASETAKVIKSYLERRDDDRAAGEELMSRISIEQLEDSEMRDVGRIIYPNIRLDNVKIKDDIRRILDDVVNSVKVSAQILDTWKLRENYPYGRCVSLLISGPPGTGKTMSANAIAGELGLPLFQVNIANIVDKYIGETEKNLEKAFSYAEKANMVLFFDEADSLFGTRSEVRDSKDRYANTEISYLLQRIESYDGIVIMATNIKGNIDSAFMRRIRYIVHFETPDEELRKQIWNDCLKDSIPHGDIDTDYLAAQFDKFTGSVIKTVFLNACAYAAGMGDQLEMKHLIHAVKQELEKMTSIGFASDTIGKYAYLV